MHESVAVQLVIKEPYLCIAPLVNKALFTDRNKDLTTKSLCPPYRRCMWGHPHHISVRQHLNNLVFSLDVKSLWYVYIHYLLTKCL